MKIFLHGFLVLCMTALLCGCRENTTDYHYLITHPKQLETAVMQCQDDVSNTSHCGEVKQAARDFTMMVNEHNQDPQAFGKKILAAQTKLVATEQEMLKATGENKTKLEKEYQKQRDDLDVMLAVVAAMTGLE